MEIGGYSALSFYLFSGAIGLLLLLLGWSLWRPREAGKLPGDLSCLEDSGWRHATLYPPIRQALAPEDLAFLAQRVSKRQLRRIRTERRQVVLSYLSLLRADFEKLLQVAQVIVLLSPEVTAAQELSRLRLKVNFIWRYRFICMCLWAGSTPLPLINDLSNLLSGYSVRLEEAMKEMGERAAFVAEMVSSPDRRRIHPV